MAHVSIQICFLFTMLDNPQMSEDTAKLLWTSQKWLLVSLRAAKCGDQPSGGARRDRTDDLMLAKHALSQLSYGPLGECKAFADSATAHSQSEWAKAPASSGKAQTPCNGGPGRTRTSDLTLIKRAL